MKKIFISHALADEPIINSLIDDLLVGALSVKVRDIFCTTTDGMKIDSGKDWRNCIQEALQKSKITLLVITSNYKESEVCMCEMGAAWVTSSKTLPFIVDPITYDNVGIIQQPKQIEKLLDEPPSWLNKIEDKESQKKHLLERVLINIHEKFEFKKHKEFEGYILRFK